MATPSRNGRIPRPAIFVCDIQEKFRPAIHKFDKVVLSTARLLRLAQPLQIPIYVTTQNSARLGPTVPELESLISASTCAHPTVDKSRFSMIVDSIANEFPYVAPSSEQSRSVAIAGIESHICVTQTALDLLAAGHKVYILADAVSSCNPEEVPIALARLRAAGAVVTTTESWIYEVMGDAKIPEFKRVVGVVKDTSEDARVALQGLLSKM